MSDLQSKPSKQVKIFCPHCEQKLDVSNFDPFDELDCPSCDNLIIVPCRFGHYLLEEPIEERELCSVYRANDLKLDRTVAVKIFSSKLTRRRRARERLVQQTRRVAALNSPHLVPIFSSGEFEGRYYISMEYMSGGSLYDKVKGEYPLSISACLHCMAQTARGMASAHREGVVHGDLNPRNILFNVEGDVKISDFGMARIDPDAELDSEGDGSNVDLRYASPEVLRGSAGDYRSDIFSLGACLYFAVTGHPPFSSKRGDIDMEMDDVSELLIAGEPIEERPDVSEELNEFILRMLALKPEERSVSCDRVISFLEETRQELPAEEPVRKSRIAVYLRRCLRKGNRGNSLSQRAVGEKARKEYLRRRRQSRIRLAAGAAVLAALAVVAMVFWRGAREEETWYLEHVQPVMNRIYSGLFGTGRVEEEAEPVPPEEEPIAPELEEDEAPEGVEDETEERPIRRDEPKVWDELPEQELDSEESAEVEPSWLWQESEPVEAQEQEDPWALFDEDVDDEEDGDFEPAGVPVPELDKRPHPEGLNFGANKDELRDYVQRNPEGVRELEKERIVRLSRMHGYLRQLMRTPFRAREEGILLENGTRIYGTIPFANEHHLAFRPADGRGNIRELQWHTVAIEQFFEFFEHYAEKRLMMRDAPQNEMFGTDPEKDAAEDFFRLALLADWYGYSERARAYSRKAVELSPGLESAIDDFLYYLD